MLMKFLINRIIDKINQDPYCKPEMASVFMLSQ